MSCNLVDISLFGARLTLTIPAEEQVVTLADKVSAVALGTLSLAAVATVAALAAEPIYFVAKPVMYAAMIGAEVAVNAAVFSAVGTCLAAAAIVEVASIIAVTSVVCPFLPLIILLSI